MKDTTVSITEGRKEFSRLVQGALNTLFLSYKRVHVVRNAAYESISPTFHCGQVPKLLQKSVNLVNNFLKAAKPGRPITRKG